jgi:hypothetical protein
MKNRKENHRRKGSKESIAIIDVVLVFTLIISVVNAFYGFAL